MRCVMISWIRYEFYYFGFQWRWDGSLRCFYVMAGGWYFLCMKELRRAAAPMINAFNHNESNHLRRTEFIFSGCSFSLLLDRCIWVWRLWVGMDKTAYRRNVSFFHLVEQKISVLDPDIFISFRLSQGGNFLRYD